jgi:hypothetical protein
VDKRVKEFGQQSGESGFVSQYLVGTYSALDYIRCGFDGFERYEK